MINFVIGFFAGIATLLFLAMVTQPDDSQVYGTGQDEKNHE